MPVWITASVVAWPVGLDTLPPQETLQYALAPVVYLDDSAAVPGGWVKHLTKPCAAKLVLCEQVGTRTQSAVNGVFNAGNERVKRESLHLPAKLPKLDSAMCAALGGTWSADTCAIAGGTGARRPPA